MRKNMKVEVDLNSVLTIGVITLAGYIGYKKGIKTASNNTKKVIMDLMKEANSMNDQRY